MTTEKLFSDLRPSFTIHDDHRWPFGWLMYFHLEGGSGENSSHPRWCAFYDKPGDGRPEQRGTKAAVPYCEESGYPYGVGETAEEAIVNLKAMLPDWIKSHSLPKR